MTTSGKRKLKNCVENKLLSNKPDDIFPPSAVTQTKRSRVFNCLLW